MAPPYSIILADPGWGYDDPLRFRRTRKTGSGAALKYTTTSVDEICALPVEGIAADDACLFMWVTMPFLFEAKRVGESWGFRYKTNAFTWVKRNRRNPLTWFWGMGKWTRSNAELCLLFTRGRPRRAYGGVHSVVEAPVGRHSAKPPEVRDRIVRLCGDLPRVELFARERAEGWDCWGDEVDGDLCVSAANTFFVPASAAICESCGRRGTLWPDGCRGAACSGAL